MPPRTRSYGKARKLTKLAHRSTREESIAENNLEICITNYFKMSKPKPCKGTTSPKVKAQFSADIEMSFATMLNDYKRSGKLTNSNINSYICPNIAERLNGLYRTTFTASQIRTKYYNFMRLTKLWNELRIRTTGLGWDELHHTVVMDDEKWEEFFKEDADYKHFKGNHCHHFDTLREVFDKHGASGSFANDSGHPPLDTDEEREFENLHSRQDKAKTPMSVIDTDSDDVEVVRPRQEKNKGKGKGKGKGKRKTPENSHGGCCRRSGPPPAYERYLEQLSQHIQTANPNSSSMSVSFGSPTPEPPVQDNPYSVTNCMKLLHALGFPPDTNARVAPKLFMNQTMCVIFVESTVEERRALVRQHDVV